MCAMTQAFWMSVLLLPVWIVDSCRMTSICCPVASTTQAWWKYPPTLMSMAKSKEIEVLLATLHSWLHCVPSDVLDMLCVCIHITVRPHIGSGRGWRSHERCGICRCLRWHHPRGVWWNRVKRPYRSQWLVPLLGVENRGQPTSHGWVAGVSLLVFFAGNCQRHNGLSETDSTIRLTSKGKQLNPDDDIFRKPSMSDQVKGGNVSF